MADAYAKSLRLPGVTIMSSGYLADKLRRENEPILANVTARLQDWGQVGAFVKPRAEQLTQQRLDAGDVTICMNQAVAEECYRSFKMPANTLVWDVDDSGEGSNVVKPGDDPYRYTKKIYLSIDCACPDKRSNTA